jgi:hypothetical protein
MSGASDRERVGDAYSGPEAEVNLVEWATTRPEPTHDLERRETHCLSAQNDAAKVAPHHCRSASPNFLDISLGPKLQRPNEQRRRGVYDLGRGSGRVGL